ncbi:hypothetical protein E2562_037102, partial [Oryza meyeriana var. granulata]
MSYTIAFSSNLLNTTLRNKSKHRLCIFHDMTQPRFVPSRAGVFVDEAVGNRGPAGAFDVSYSPWATTVTAGRSYT